MKINLRGCRWERHVPQTTRDNSVQSQLKETVHIFCLLCHNHTEIVYIVFNTLQRAASCKRNITFIGFVIL